MPYQWNEQTYERLQDVADASGYSVNTVAAHLDEFGTLEYLGKDRRVIRSLFVSRQIIGQAKQGRTVAELECAFGVSRARVIRALKETEEMKNVVYVRRDEPLDQYFKSD